MHKVFVYGTLKHGFYNHSPYLLGKKYKKAKALGVNLHAGPYFPYAIKGSGVAFGEVYEVDDATLDKLDRLEGVPNHYQRDEVFVFTEDFKKEKAMIYVSDHSLKFPRIESGEWMNEKTLV
jgi:gamma-glutamylcyclotransferase (GGCT)/AIG2-like uncharacterized protein YtfP